jgi:hypothetical protein
LTVSDEEDYVPNEFTVRIPMEVWRKLNRLLAEEEMTMEGLLQKVTLNLYHADVEEMKRLFGYGWSAELRELLHKYLERRKGNEISPNNASG